MTSYDGGKGGSGVFQWIINHIPRHTHYIDLFLGNSAVMRYKRPADVCSVGVEINPAVIAEFWRASSLPGVIVRQGDALSFLAELILGGETGPDTFLYCDPPYLMETRSCQRQLYEFEFAEIEQHRALLSALRSLPCMVALSGYWSELYELELAGWRTDLFWTVNRAGKRVQEWLWMNYPPPLELHDYRYLGKNFRERERIKRKKARWTERLKRMPDQERYALLDAIGSLRSGSATDGEGAGGTDGNSEAPGAIVSAGGVPGGSAEHGDTRRRHSPDLAMVDEHPDPIARSDEAIAQQQF